MRALSKNKKAHVNLIDLIAGIVVIVGGVLITASYSNLGVVVATIGLLIEGIKIITKLGP